MSDNAQPVGATPEPTNSNPQPVGDAAPAEPSQPFKAYATAEDYEAHKAKIQEAANREAAKLRAELDRLRKQNESEQDKAIREAKEAAKAEAMGEIKSASLNAALTALGLEGAKLKAAIAAAPEEWENVGDAITSIREGLPELFGKAKPYGGGNGQTPAPTETLWTDEAVDAAIANGTYEKHREEILKARSRGRPTPTVSVRRPH